MNLYEMTQAAHDLYELLESGEIDEQTLLDTMENIGAGERLESYVYVQKQLEAEILAFESEIERMTARKKSLEKHVERLKDAQVAYMMATGQKSVKAGTFKLTIRESKSCDIQDVTAIPAQYMIEIPASYKPDKRAMLDALKKGAEISGVSLKTGYSVVAK